MITNYIPFHENRKTLQTLLEGDGEKDRDTYVR